MFFFFGTPKVLAFLAYRFGMQFGMRPEMINIGSPGTHSANVGGGFWFTFLNEEV